MADRPSLAQKVISAITGLPPASRTESGFRPAVDPRERRRFRRIDAPVYCRPAGVVFARQEESIDVSRGGVRVYSDEELAVGERLTLELFLKDQPSVTFDAEVAWIESLDPGAPGKFDVGLKFVHLTAANDALLSKVLESRGDK